MPDPDAIIATSFHFEPPLEGDPSEALADGRELEVVLEGDRRLRVDPEDSRSVGFVRVLDGLARQRLPAYIEIEPATDTIRGLRIPTVGRVVDLRSGPDGVLEVRLDASHARHRLRPQTEGAEQLEEQLRTALVTVRSVLIVEDDVQGIIDLTMFTPDPEVPLPPFPRPVPLFPPGPRSEWWLLWLIRKLWWWLWYPWWWWNCPTPATIQGIFAAMAATTCNPLTVPAPCIPFMFPDDGCWARANEMCRLMENMGHSPRKVWIDGNLETPTANHPSCKVYWGWHVAPTLCVRTRLFLTERWVIDPSLFSTPVTKATWKGVQGDPSAILTDTDASQFWPYGGTDPTYSDTNFYLAKYRLELMNRSNQVGPPPYNCP
jgi:hypothetical protein